MFSSHIIINYLKYLKEILWYSASPVFRETKDRYCAPLFVSYRGTERDSAACNLNSALKVPHYLTMFWMYVFGMVMVYPLYSHICSLVRLFGPLFKVYFSVDYFEMGYSIG